MVFGDVCRTMHTGSQRPYVYAHCRMVSLAGGSVAGNQPLDGHNQWPALTGQGPDPRTEMLYGISPVRDALAGPPQAGLRMGDYKVLCWTYTIAGLANGTVTGPCSPCPNASDPELKKGCVLFDLAADPAETTNLATQKPDVLAKLLNRLKELALESVEPMLWDPPFQGPGYYCADCPKHPQGTGLNIPWGPWCRDNGENHTAPCVPLS